MEKNKKNLIPVTVLTGFLGSGKTTLLNYILSENHGKKIAVIENEFGEVGIDDKLVKNKIFGDEQIIEMMNGCICCTVRGDLVVALKELVKKMDKFDYILIETTGLADPAPVAQTFFVEPEIQKFYRLDAIITVVDAKHIEQHLNEKKAEGVENESIEQLAFADRILLNKIDLVTQEDLVRLKSRIKSINHTAEIIETQNSIVDLNKILDISSFDIEAVLKLEPDFLENQEHQHDDTISSFGLQFEGNLLNESFQDFIDELIQKSSNDLFRYKGVISFKGLNKKVIFQGIHMLFMLTYSEEDWDVEDDEERMNYLIFIGRNLNTEEIKNGIELCKVSTDKLRFKINDKVQCRVGEKLWKKGRVVKKWDQGFPYKVKLNDDSMIHVPYDHEEVIRAKQ